MATTDTLPVGFDYGTQLRVMPGVLTQRAESGRLAQRRRRPDVRAWRVAWAAQPTDNFEALRAFHARMQGQFFVLDYPTWQNNAGVYAPRKFPVRFTSGLEAGYVGNEQYPLAVDVEEAPGEALPAGSYPGQSGVGFDSWFIEERDGDAKDQVVLAGTWAIDAHANHHGTPAEAYQTSTVNSTATWEYAGYGFKLWGRKNASGGSAGILLDGVSLGSVSFNNGSDIAAAVLHTKLDVPLGVHTVQIRCDSGTVWADAIEVFQ